MMPKLPKLSISSLTLLLAGASLLPANALAQHGQWHVADGNPMHDNSQSTESQINLQSISTTFKFLWKLKLGDGPPASFNEFLFTPSMISSRGFKDIGLWADSSNVYAVDYELGTLFWQKHLDVKSAGACGTATAQILMEPPRIIRFGAKSAAPPAGVRPTPPPPPPAAADRWIGAPSPGGGFGLKGIYVLTSDGYLHEQIMATGLDYAPPVKLVPTPTSKILGLNMNDKVVYTESTGSCAGASNAVYAIDLNTSQLLISSYPLNNLTPADIAGPVIGPDGTIYISTAPGTAANIHASSIIALSAKDLKPKDWFTISKADTLTAIDMNDVDHGQHLNLTPIVISYKDKDWVAAAGKDGSIVLLDANSLGGADHHTPLTQTPSLSTTTPVKAWEGLASSQDKTGNLYLLASIAGPLTSEIKFPNSAGTPSHGSIVAFKIDTQGPAPVLSPLWVSHDLLNPAPPVIANGIAFALAGGDIKHHATLFAFDLATGKQLFSSGDTISSYSQLSGLSVGDRHIFFTTHDNTLYSFGIPLEH